MEAEENLNHYIQENTELFKHVLRMKANRMPKAIIIGKHMAE